ncbi:MAG: ABC transporter permease [Acidobacteriota bacterium]
MSGWLRDLRFAARLFRRRPGFTAASVVCLGLGIGAVATMFALIDAVLLKPLPFADADRMVMVWNHFLQRDLPEFPSSGHEFADHRRGNGAFSHVAGVLPWDFNLSAAGSEPLRVEGARASAALFSSLGVEAALGRVYSEEEETAGRAVAVISDGLWRRQFGGEEAARGRQISLDGVPHTVVGVLPPFDLEVVEADVWVPFTPNPAIPRFMRGVLLIARLADGLTLEQAQAETSALAARLQSEYPDIYKEGSGWGMHLTPLREEVVGDVRPLLWTLFGAVLLVLLIACVNVANLQITQATVRGGELAVRAALGAGRRTLARQLLAESLMLSAGGGALGIALGVLAGRILLRLDPGTLPRLHQVALNGRVVAVVLAFAAFTGILVGLWPALRVSRANLQSALKDGGRGGDAGFQRKGLRAGLAVAEIALAMTVLIAAGLMVRSVDRMSRSHPGFEAENRLSLQIVLSRATYAPAERKLEYYRALRSALEGLPGVEEVAVVSHLPGSGKAGLRGVPQAAGRPPVPGTPTPPAGIRMVSPGYFRTLGIPLERGRDFTDADDAQAPPVVVIDRAVAERFWPHRDAIGQELEIPGLFEQPRRVVGVVGEVNHQGLADEPQGELYLAYPQMPTFDLAPVLHTRGDPMALAEEARRALLAVDPTQPAEDVRAMTERLRGSIAQPRFQAVVFSLFGAVALALALIGVYGVMAFAVARRTRELGIRMALGAHRGDVLALVLRSGLRLAVVGVAAGLVLAWLTVRLLSVPLETLASGISATDPATFLAVPLLLSAMALLASWVPARRATRIDPMVALRHD